MIHASAPNGAALPDRDDLADAIAAALEDPARVAGDARGRRALESLRCRLLAAAWLFLDEAPSVEGEHVFTDPAGLTVRLVITQHQPEERPAK